MQLEQLKLSLRHCSPPQATDLGFRVAQHWYPKLWIIWAVPVFACYVLCALFFPPEWMAYASLGLWLCKPLWDAGVILFLSRVIFGEKMAVWQVWRDTPRMMGGSIFAWLTWRRLSPTRSASLPVSVLEHLGGTPRKKRLKVLLYFSWSAAASRLLVVCLFMETVIVLGLIAFFILMAGLDVTDYSFSVMGETNSAILTHVSIVLFLLAASIVGPFYASSGFMLYLMRRVELEGWDIEVRFRAMAARLSSKKPAAVLIIALCLFAPWSAQDSFAAEAAANQAEIVLQRQQAEERIKEVVDSFHHEKTRKIKTRSDNNGLDGLPSFDPPPFTFPSLLKAALIVVLVITILFVIIKRGKLLQLGLSGKKRPTPAETLFGMDVRPDSIPENVPDQVLKYWREGNPRTALGLLYRASLSRLLNRKNVPLMPFHTEQDCIRLTNKYAPEAGEAFDLVTKSWQTLAWGHVLPEETVVLTLCQRWQGIFDNVA